MQKQKVWITGVLFCLMISLSSSLSAAGGATVTVDPIEGKAGDEVTVTVQVEGISEIPGIEGFAGGEFKLVYDPATAEPKKVTKGELLSDGALFVYNEAYAEDTVAVTWVSTGAALSKDGALCHVTFLLKKGGELAPVIEGLGVCDEHTRPLVVVADTGETGGEGAPAVGIYKSSAVAGVDYPAPGEAGGGEGAAATGDEASGEAQSSDDGEKFLTWQYVLALTLLVVALVVFFYLMRRRSGGEISG